MLDTAWPGSQLVQWGRVGRQILTWRIMGGGLKVTLLNQCFSIVHLHPSGYWYSLMLETARPGGQLVQWGREGRPVLLLRIMGGELKVTW
jgi:hypothetical protein